MSENDGGAAKFIGLIEPHLPIGAFDRVESDDCAPIILRSGNRRAHLSIEHAEDILIGAMARECDTIEIKFMGDHWRAGVMHRDTQYGEFFAAYPEPDEELTPFECVLHAFVKAREKARADMIAARERSRA